MASASSTIAARLDRLPRAKYTRNLIILISLGGCFELYDLFFAAYIAPGLFAGKHVHADHQMFFGFDGFASFVAALFAGLFIGTLILVSHLSDRSGGARSSPISLLWYTAATLVMAFQNTRSASTCGASSPRIGIGVELVTIDAYVSELVPRSIAAAPSPSTRPSASSRCRWWPSSSYLLVPTSAARASTAGAGWC